MSVKLQPRCLGLNMLIDFVMAYQWRQDDERPLHHPMTHYDDVIMTILASQITSLTVVYSIVYSGVHQRKHQSSASLAFVREIHRGPVNFPHKWPVTREMLPFDDVIMKWMQRNHDMIHLRTNIAFCTYFSTSQIRTGTSPVIILTHIVANKLNIIGRVWEVVLPLVC